MRKAVAIVGSVGVPSRYGGFETLAHNLSVKLNNQFDIHVFCSRKAYSKMEQTEEWNGISRHFIRLSANGLSSILYDLLSIIKAAKYSKTILILGGSAGIFFGIFKLIFPKHRLIFHMDGLEWNRSKWSFFSKLFLRWSINRACRNSHRIIIDNYALLSTIKNKYLNKVNLISYGGDQYGFIDHTEENLEYWLTIARAEPENNLHLVAEAFKNMPLQNWLLISNYTDTRFGRKLYNTYKDFGNIRIIDSVYDPGLLTIYFRKAKGYIHPHSVGGTNPSLVTAMWMKCILICHDNAFNRSTTNNKAIYFNSAQNINSIITDNSSLTLNQEIHEFAKENYAWQKIADLYAKLINDL